MQRLFVLLLMLVAGSGPALAAGSIPGGELSARLSNATMRGQIWTGSLNEAHIWRFRPDGSLSGTFTAVPLGSQSSNSFIDVSDEGRWEVSEGRLCVQWRRFLDGIRQCYTLMPLRAGWVRFANVTGGPSFDAQLGR